VIRRQFPKVRQNQFQLFDHFEFWFEEKSTNRLLIGRRIDCKI